MALPKWLDQVPNVDFAREKEALLDILAWATSLGWRRVDPSGLEFNARRESDVALENVDRKLRIAVQSKSSSKEGMIRIQAIPTFRDALIVWQPRRRKWEIELGGVPMDRTWDEESFSWLVSRLFAA